MTSISNSTSSSAASALQAHPHRGRPPQFSKLDSDGSGGLDKTELKAMMDKRPGKTESSAEVDIDAMFSKLDSDGDGGITESELKAGAKAQKDSDNSGASMSQMGMSTQAFAGMMGPPPMGPPDKVSDDEDSDENTTVSSTDSSASTNKLQQLLEALDTDKSGDIGSSEIKAFEDQMKTLVSRLHSMAGQQYASVANSGAASSSDASSSLSVMA